MPEQPEQPQPRLCAALRAERTRCSPPTALSDMDVGGRLPSAIALYYGRVRDTAYLEPLNVRTFLRSSKFQYPTVQYDSILQLSANVLMLGSLKSGLGRIGQVSRTATSRLLALRYENFFAAFVASHTYEKSVGDENRLSTVPGT